MSLKSVYKELQQEFTVYSRISGTCLSGTVGNSWKTEVIKTNFLFDSV